MRMLLKRKDLHVSNVPIAANTLATGRLPGSPNFLVASKRSGEASMIDIWGS